MFFSLCMLRKLISSYNIRSIFFFFLCFNNVNFVSLCQFTLCIQFLHLFIAVFSFYLLFPLQEAVVVLAPLYVKHGKDYYRRCFLTFSQRFIRLEGSPLSDRKRTHCVEWPTSDILDIVHQQCESVSIQPLEMHFSDSLLD